MGFCATLFTSTYQLYKRHTNDICQWLSSASADTEEPTIEYRSAGRGRRKRKIRLPAEAKTAAPTSVAVDQLVGMAQKIAQDPLKMASTPKIIIAKLEKTIHLRRQFLNLYAKKTPTDGQESEEEREAKNNQHAYFVRILEQILTHLKPARKSESKGKATTETKPVECETADFTHTLNSFYLLDVEEMEDEDVAAETQAPVVVVHRPSNVETEVNKSRDERDEAEVLFATFCLFMDMLRLKRMLRDHWEQYKAGQVSLETVALMSNTAIATVHKAEDDFLATFSHHFSENPSWLDIISPLSKRLYSQYEKALDDVALLDDHLPRTDAVAELICLYPGWILTNVTNQVAGPPIIPVAVEVFNPSNWNVDRSTLSPKEVLGHDQAILTHVFTECSILEYVRAPNNIDDEATAGLRMIYTMKQPIRPWLVFAASLVLISHSVLGTEATRPCEELHLATRQGDAIFEKYKAENDRSMPTEARLLLPSLLSFLTHSCILTDSIADIKKRMGYPMGLTQSFHLHKLNPLLCGTKLLVLRLVLSELGTQIGKASRSLIQGAQTYNAFQQLGGLRVKWPDMEQFIAMHTPEKLFSGRTPTTIDQCCTTFHLNEGLTTNLRRLSRGPRVWFVPSETQQILHDLAFGLEQETRGYFDRSARTLARLMVVKGFGVPTVRGAQSVGSVAQILAVKSMIEAELPRLHFDYLSLHMRCNELSSKLSTELDTYFIDVIGKHWIDSRGDGFPIFGWILITSQAVRHKSDKYLKMSLPSYDYSYTLITGAEVLERLLVENKNWGDCQTYKLGPIKKETKLINLDTREENASVSEAMSHLDLD